MVYFAKNLIYLGCIVVSLVIGLSVWTTWHIPLSQLLISRQIAFLILFVVGAAVVLVLANALLNKWGLRHVVWWKEHLQQSYLLYLVMTADFLLIMSRPIGNGAEGLGIGARVLFFLAAYGAVINAVCSYLCAGQRIAQRR